MEKFQNRYRIASIRMQAWDYKWKAAYFVTICTKNKAHFFGDIDNGKMLNTELGNIVEPEWQKSFEIRPKMNLTMGEYVVMPNHFHGIVMIGDNPWNDRNDDNDCDIRRDALQCVSTNCPNCNPMNCPNCNPRNCPNCNPTHCPNCIPIEKSLSKNEFGPQSKNLASIIRGFKSAVTKNAKLINPQFGWQARFHDRIIRDQQEFQNVSRYIKNNLIKWKSDSFNSHK